MSDPSSDSAPEAAAATIRCSWCSTESPAATLACPSCGASLVASKDNSVPGVTSLDTEAILRSRKIPRSRGGLLGFLSGDAEGAQVPSEAELVSLAPPPADVRMEIMRLELEAERQRLESEAASLAADASDAGEGPMAPVPPAPAPPNDVEAQDSDTPSA